MRRVGLIVYRGPSQKAAEDFLALNPHPAWRPPRDPLGGVDACTGPFKIIENIRSWIPYDERWTIVAEHDDSLAAEGGEA